MLGTTSLGAFIGTVMFTSVNVALPSLVTTFGTQFNVVQWVVLAYLLATGTLLPIVGRLADMLGKKKLYLAGYVVFTLGSLLCSLAPNITSLILARTVQGLGSAFLTALGLAILTDTFPAEERGRAIGINGSLLSTGIVIGPTLGGVLIDALSWRWIFIVAVPLGLLGTFLAQRFIQPYEVKQKQRFDLLGSVLLFGTLLSFLLALTVGQDRGFTDPLILALFAVSAVLLVVFIITELRTEQPLLELRLFRNPQLSVGLITGFITFISISGTIFLIPFYLTYVLGYSARSIGLLLSVAPIVLVITAPIAGTLADRYGERPVTVFGLASMVVGYFTISTLGTDTTAFGYVLRFLPVALGMAVFQTPNNSAIMGSVAAERSGVAGGLLALTRTLGSSAGIAVLGTLWAARVFARTGTVGVATDAPPPIQVAAMQDMFRVIEGMILIAFALVIWDAVRQRRLKGQSKTPQVAGSSD